MEDCIRSLDRRENRSALPVSLPMYQIFGIAYIFGIVFLPSHVRRQDMGEAPFTEASEKRLYPGGHISEERCER